MNTLREAAQQALEALEHLASPYHACADAVTETIDALRAALAQPEQEPVAWLTDKEEMHFDKEDAYRYSDGFIQPLYAAPPQREWVGLTVDEADAIVSKYDDMFKGAPLRSVGNLIVFEAEDKLKEKNG